MGSILPVHALIVDQARVAFVNQRGRLEAMASALTPHVTIRQAMKFVVDRGSQPLERILIPVAPCTEERADRRSMRDVGD